MACCAFALFVLGQIAAALVALRRALPLPFLAAPPEACAPRNPATAWQLHPVGPRTAGPARAARRPWRRLGPRLVLVALLEIALLAGGAAFALGGDGSGSGSGPASTLAGWCGSAPPEGLASFF